MRAIWTALLIAAVSCGAAWAQTVGGIYAVSGTNPDGSTYTGTVNITLNGQACQISWSVGSTPATGNCLLFGNAFASYYRLNGQLGLVVYQLRSDGSLSGNWEMDAQSGVGTETLTPSK
jgi:hypothetical protein